MQTASTQSTRVSSDFLRCCRAGVQIFGDIDNSGTAMQVSLLPSIRPLEDMQRLRKPRSPHVYEKGLLPGVRRPWDLAVWNSRNVRFDKLAL